MMSVWIVQYDCSDYYCENEHVLDVFATRELAEQAMAHMTESESRMRDSYRPRNVYYMSEWTARQ